MLRGGIALSRTIRKRGKKAGLPPGTLVHVGERKAGNAKITIINYDEHHFEEREVQNVEDCFPFKSKPTVTWINIDGLHQLEIIQKSGEHLKIHRLSWKT